MTDFRLSIDAVWSDVDLLEVVAALRFQEWSGSARAYATRDDLRAFARELVAVEEGARLASLAIGQPELGYAIFRIFEYSGARRLAMDVRLGHAARDATSPYDFARAVTLTVPIERGQLGRFASELQNLVLSETGSATLPLLSDWP